MSSPLQSTNAPPPARLLKSKVLYGSNIYYNGSVFVQRLELGRLSKVRTGALGSEFAARFTERFADGLPKFGDTERIQGKLLERLHGDAGIPAEEALFEAMLAVELSMGFTMGRLERINYAEIFRRERGQVVDIVWECHTPGISRDVARVGLAGLSELLPDAFTGSTMTNGDSFAVQLARLQRRARRRQWSPKAAALSAAAKQQGVPCESLGDEYLLLGQGAAQQVVYAANLAREADIDVLPHETAPAVRTSLAPRSIQEGFGRIQTALVVGRRGTNLVARDLEWILRSTSKCVGLATTKRTTIAGGPIKAWSMGRSDAARFLLQDPRLEMLIAATSLRRIENHGLRIDGCTVAALVDSSLDKRDERETSGIDVILQATTGLLVIDMENPLGPRVIRTLGAARVIFVCSKPGDSFSRRDLAMDAIVVCRTLRSDTVYVDLQRGRETILTVPVPGNPSANREKSERHIRARMFAIALAYGLELSPRQIETAAKRHIFLPE